MDQWFKDLFDIISSQKKANKIDLLLLELYSEFDILARNRDKDELIEIYNFIKDENPINTNDIVFNKDAFLILKKELMTRLILLNDLSVIDEEIERLIIDNNKKDIKDFHNLWRTNAFIYKYIEDKINDKDLLKKKAKKVEPKPIQEIYSEPIIEETKKEIIEEPSDIHKEAITEEKISLFKSTTPIKKPEPIIKETPKPKKILNHSDAMNLFFDLIARLNAEYDINLDIVKLKQQSNPKRGVYTAVKEYIDRTDINAVALLKMFNLFKEFNEEELIDYLADMSKTVRKVCTFNIGLLSEEYIDEKKKIIEFISENKSDYISLSLCEVILHEFIESKNYNDVVTHSLLKYSTKASLKVPKIIKAHEVSDCIEYFESSVYPKQSRKFDSKNINHLYLAMILSAYLGIYIEREYESDYSKSIKLIVEIANSMIALGNQNLEMIIRTLAKSYISKIYKSATISENYDSWWDRQKEDLNDAKLEAIMNLNE